MIYLSEYKQIFLFSFIPPRIHTFIVSTGVSFTKYLISSNTIIYFISYYRKDTGIENFITEHRKFGLSRVSIYKRNRKLK